MGNSDQYEETRPDLTDRLTRNGDPSLSDSLDERPHDRTLGRVPEIHPYQG